MAISSFVNATVTVGFNTWCEEVEVVGGIRISLATLAVVVTGFSSLVNEERGCNDNSFILPALVPKTLSADNNDSVVLVNVIPLLIGACVVTVVVVVVVVVDDDNGGC